MFKIFYPIFPAVLIIAIFSGCEGAQMENTYYNGRLVNLAPQQFKVLETMEKRLYGRAFDEKVTIDRIEQLESDLYGSVQKGSAITRLNNLKIKSMRESLRGTSIPPSMTKYRQNKYLQEENSGYYDDVGLIDGFIRLWFPEFYAQISQYRMLKESKGINDLYF